MIKIGRLPGKLYQVEFEEGMTVGQAITKARALAEEQGKSLDVAGCQIRISGNEVSESALLANNSVVTISQKIKGNADKLIKITYNNNEEELIVDDNTEAGEILDILGIEENSNLAVKAVSGEFLDDDDTLLSHGENFIITEREDDDEEDDDYESDDYDYDDDDDDEPHHACNCCQCNEVPTITSGGGVFGTYEEMVMDISARNINISIKVSGSETHEMLANIMKALSEKAKDLLEQ